MIAIVGWYYFSYHGTYILSLLLSSPYHHYVVLLFEAILIVVAIVHVLIRLLLHPKP